MTALSFRLGVLFLVVLLFLALYSFSFPKPTIKSLSVGTILNQSVEEAQLPSTPLPDITKRLKVMFFGDIMLGRDVELLMLKNGISYPFSSFTINKESSFAFANFESAVPSQHEPTPYNTFRFSTDAKFLSELARAGFTHVSLANNHSFDYGLPGYNNTIAKMWENNLAPFGHPTILATSSVTVVETENYDVAVIGVHTLFSKPKPKDIKSVVAYAESLSDLQIVYIHWGNEYEEEQGKSQRELAVEFAKAGVDLIVGHHPHVVQGVEKIDNTIVVYSLGNFIFDQYFSDSVQLGLALSLVLEKEPYLELIPVSSLESRARPTFMAGSSKELFLDELSLKSDPDLKEEIQAGIIKFEIPLATSSEVVIMAL